MESLKKRMSVNQDGFIKVPVPPSFGKQVEIIVLPVTYEQGHDESEYFECVAEDGTVYRLKDWTDSEFNKASMMSACKNEEGHLDFLAATYLAAIEDDDEDAFGKKYCLG